MMARTVSIDARAQKDFEPDQFRVEVSFHGEYDDKAECTRAFNGDLKRVKEALAKVGVPVDEIVSRGYRVVTHYEWRYEKCEGSYGEWYRRGERFVEGYEYDGDCSFKCKMDPALLAAIWVALQSTEGDFSYEIEYMIERPDEREREILRDAVVAARGRAEVLADAAGAKLGEVASIDYGFAYEEELIHRLNKCCCAPDDGYDDFDDAPSLIPEPIPISCKVSVSWELLQG